MSETPTERVWAHFNRPLWEALGLSDGEPYGGLYGPQTDRQVRRGTVDCYACGARVMDRGLHYRFHVQISVLLAQVVGERVVLGTVTSEDEDAGHLIEHFDHGVLTDTHVAETFEVRDGLGNVIATITEESSDGSM